MLEGAAFTRTVGEIVTADFEPDKTKKESREKKEKSRKVAVSKLPKKTWSFDALRVDFESDSEVFVPIN